MRRRRRNPGDGLPLILGGIAVSGAALVALVLWGRSNAKVSSSSPAAPLPSGPEPVGLFPDLAFGDQVIVDVEAASIPHGPGTSIAICVVDLVMTDRSVVSVRSVGGVPPFAGTIPRSAIVRVLPRLPPGVFA